MPDQSLAPFDHDPDRECSCQILTAFSDIEGELEKDWDDLVLETKASLYVTPAWASVWWEIYGDGQPLRIFVFRSEGELVGVMPVYIGEIRIGPIKTRVARFVGAYHPARLHELPIRDRYVASVGRHLVRQLLGPDRCDVISLGFVSEECQARKVLLETMAHATARAKEIPFGIKTFFDLPDSYDAYLKSLSGGERKKRKYYEKLLGKEHPLTQIEIREAAEIDTEMPKFMSLHKINWQRQGKLGYFSAWPKSDVFNHRLAVRLAGLGRTLLIRVSAGEIPIIYQYGYVFGDGFYWELPARASGDEWDRFSLGATAIMILIRRSIESGIRRIEAGLSHYEYKTRLGARDLGVYVLRFVGRAPGSQAKYFLCRMLHRFLQMVYYRLWYTRIQPRLPQAFCRPIWMIYIRMIL